jgi:ABC-type nitrate/sulfonate/bicarbonate transport system permease component
VGCDRAGRGALTIVAAGDLARGDLASNLGETAGAVAFATLGALVGAFLAAALMLLAIRYRAGSRLLRQQVKWLALICVVFVIAIVFIVLGTAAGHSGDWLVTIAYNVGEIWLASRWRRPSRS